MRVFALRSLQKQHSFEHVTTFCLFAHWRTWGRCEQSCGNCPCARLCMTAVRLLASSWEGRNHSDTAVAPGLARPSKLYSHPVASLPPRRQPAAGGSEFSLESLGTGWEIRSGV